MLLDFLEDIFGDLIIKSVRNVSEHLEDYSLFHPRLAAAGKVLLYLFVTLGGTAWFAIRARIAWEAGEQSQMELYLICGLSYLLLIGFLCLCRLIRWLRKQKDTMYDPPIPEITEENSHAS